MNLTLKVWRQKNAEAKGYFETFEVKDISSEMSFLEMFDVLNERLISEGKDPIAFDSDCSGNTFTSLSLKPYLSASRPSE